MNDQAIEQEIQTKGLTAPRVTPNDIEANIAAAFFFTAEQGVDGSDIQYLREMSPGEALHIVPITSDAVKPGDTWPSLRILTFCVLVLRNGFTVTGESACASPENFDAEIGREIARKNAVQKIWPLMGYELKCRLSAQ